MPNRFASADFSALSTVPEGQDGKPVLSEEEIEAIKSGDLERENPIHQIIATAAYLAEMYERPQAEGMWGRAMVLYHTGPAFSQKNLEAAKRANHGMPGMASVQTVDDYMDVAAAYYGASQWTDNARAQ